jgi:hypothetical protein
VEVRQREDDALELRLLGAAVHDLVSEVVERPLQVLQDALRGLVGQLERVLQQRDGQALRD